MDTSDYTNVAIVKDSPFADYFNISKISLIEHKFILEVMIIIEEVNLILLAIQHNPR